jgi:hypothetical protein
MSDPLWQRVGNYDVMVDSDHYRIFPKNRQGETIPVTISKQLIHLRAVPTGRVTTFKRFKHRGKWKWSDSRHKRGGCSEQHVRAELARMIFRGDGEAAGALIEATAQL